jgi:hypothetical protein
LARSLRKESWTPGGVQLRDEVKQIFQEGNVLRKAFLFCCSFLQNGIISCKMPAHSVSVISEAAVLQKKGAGVIVHEKMTGA